MEDEEKKDEEKVENEKEEDEKEKKDEEGGWVGAKKLFVVATGLGPTLMPLVLAGFLDPVSQISSFKSFVLLSLIFLERRL